MVPPTLDHQQNAGTGASDTRAELIKAAAAMIEGQGADAATLRAVGAAIGVTQTTVYRHFRNKDELLGAVAGVWFAELGAVMLRAWRKHQGDPSAALRALVAAWVEYVFAHPARYRFMLSETITLRGGDAAWAPATQAYGVFQTAVANALAAGVISGGSAGAMTGALYGSVHGILDLALAGLFKNEPDLDPLPLIDLVLDQFMGPHAR
jgi:AcrR family transcriptional regulator